MTEEQAVHVQQIIATFRILVVDKYTAGAKEHGGNIWDQSALQLVENAIHETVDQFVYLVTLREKIIAQQKSES